MKVIPLGFNHHQHDQQWKEYQYIDKTVWCDAFFHKENGFQQLGTLGGGNHFIELGINELDDVWIVIHSGSRGVGNLLAKHYMALARPDNTPKEGVYGLKFDSPEGQAYYRDMSFMLEFALENRRQMITKIMEVLKTFDPSAKALEGQLINRTHNHAEPKGNFIIHRKGATHAEKDMLGVIPGHMTHGSYIVVGRGNPDSLYSSSHGAGRVLGRKAAERTLDLDIMKLQIEEAGVAAGADNIKSLQEAPDAYKPPEDVMALQQDLISVVYHIKPLVNIKG